VTRRSWPIIAVGDVARSLQWYQRLFGQTPTPPAHDYFGQVLDDDGTVLLCLHAWGAHDHPTLSHAERATPGHGLLLFFRLDDFDDAVARARALAGALELEPEVNPATRTREIALRDPDGYYVMLSATPVMARSHPPAVLQIVREPIKPGDEAAYEAIESEIAAACVALGCPHPHLALETLTGQKEIWWFNLFDSEEDRARVTRAFESNRPLMEMLARSSEKKARHTGPTIDTISRYRRDLGPDRRWDLIGARYVVVSFGDAALATGGPVFVQPDGACFAVRFFKALDASMQAASSGGTVLRFRPSWGMPAWEVLDADRDFWGVNPVAAA
jgi:catechol 2,3-dioxygenase-like lactoylglutathione lyase family enzyme